MKVFYVASAVATTLATTLVIELAIANHRKQRRIDRLHTDTMAALREALRTPDRRQLRHVR